MRELEHYCALSSTDDGARLLTDIFDDAEKWTWGMGTALPSTRGLRNPILDAAWEQYPWGNRVERQEEEEEEEEATSP